MDVKIRIIIGNNDPCTCPYAYSRQHCDECEYGDVCGLSVADEYWDGYIGYPKQREGLLGWSWMRGITEDSTPLQRKVYLEMRFGERLLAPNGPHCSYKKIDKKRLGTVEPKPEEQRSPKEWVEWFKQFEEGYAKAVKDYDFSKEMGADDCEMTVVWFI